MARDIYTYIFIDGGGRKGSRSSSSYSNLKMDLAKTLGFFGIPLWMIQPGAEPHVRRSYISLSCPLQRWGRIVPLPKSLVGLKRFLEVLFYWELAWIIFGLVMSLLHLCILCYSSLYEGPNNNSFFCILAAMCGLGFFRVFCCCIILERVRDLRAVWWSRSVLGETMQLLKSACWQLQRLACCGSFCAFFAALHVMYTDNSCDINSPILCRYMSVLVLCFLSLLGPNVVLFLSTVCAFFFACVTTDAHLGELFIDEPIESHSLPTRMLHKLREERWSKLMYKYTPATAPLYSGIFDAAICSICLCDYQLEELVRTLPCGHHFHSVCIARWFKAHASCPLRCHINFSTGQIKLPRRTSTQAPSAIEERGEEAAASLVLHVPEEPIAAAAEGRRPEEDDAVGDVYLQSGLSAAECIRPCSERQWGN